MRYIKKGITMKRIIRLTAVCLAVLIVCTAFAGCFGTGKKMPEKEVVDHVYRYSEKELISVQDSGYDSEEELSDTIEALKYMQSNSAASIDEDITVPVRFSLGYCLVKGETNYQELFKEADEKMYQNKLECKKSTSVNL